MTPTPVPPVPPLRSVHVGPADGRGLCLVRVSLDDGSWWPQSAAGLGLDGSGSMSALYAEPRYGENEITPAVRLIAAALARGAGDGRVSLAYWGCGPQGTLVETGDAPAAGEAAVRDYPPPERYGGRTPLLPALRHFCEQRAAPWAVYTFLTDGPVADPGPVAEYTAGLAAAIAAGRRPPLALLLVVAGPADHRQLAVFRDAGPDLWDGLFDRAVAGAAAGFPALLRRVNRVAPAGRVRSAGGAVLREYAAGMPADVEFVAANGDEFFELEFGGIRVRQPLAGGPSAATI